MVPYSSFIDCLERWESKKTFVILFDEFGTPTFAESSGIDIFAGIVPIMHSEATGKSQIFEAFKKRLKLLQK